MSKKEKKGSTLTATWAAVPIYSPNLIGFLGDFRSSCNILLCGLCDVGKVNFNPFWHKCPHGVHVVSQPLAILGVVEREHNSIRQAEG